MSLKTCALPFHWTALPVACSKWQSKCINEPPHDKTNKMAYAPSEDSDQPGHPRSLIRVLAARSVGS